MTATTATVAAATVKTENRHYIGYFVLKCVSLNFFFAFKFHFECVSWQLPKRWLMPLQRMDNWKRKKNWKPGSRWYSNHSIDDISHTHLTLNVKRLVANWTKNNPRIGYSATHCQSQSVHTPPDVLKSDLYRCRRWCIIVMWQSRLLPSTDNSHRNWSIRVKVFFFLINRHSRADGQMNI